ncbi:hypothetical protein [Streptomyces uncialis]|uniref:Uncharacterized protein n=1 Tax=Streptomyces uncialis TaxID=1048205 RepID=A0A1Q4VAE7_9ACTN|nr:hypothetical protein [Streptomyces uncialis]MCX4658579.1 hypothetical protein [Streptomyces uncialis]OKH94806.1 hypothetical protein AB852_11535 [Streptomyces uncialis]
MALTTPPTTSDPPTVPVPPAPVPRPGYRDRLLAHYARAAEERIGRARAAALELGHTDPVPWDDIRAACTRPSRTTWKALQKLAGQARMAAVEGSLVVGFLILALLTIEVGLETTGKETQTAAVSAARRQGT